MPRIAHADAKRVLLEEIPIGKPFSYQGLIDFCAGRLRDEWPNAYPRPSTYTTIVGNVVGKMLGHEISVDSTVPKTGYVRVK